ncbi:MAG TPA: substrate-binding domain-containing protein [Longimicrobiales bacterium]
MSRVSLSLLALPALLLLAACTRDGRNARSSAEELATRPALRVCSDPNNLPFSDSTGAGFENRIAELIADELDMRVEYTWWAQRRGFVRNTLRAGLCDVVMGIPSSYDLLLPTRPYYRSTYVFVTRADRDLHVGSIDDPQLRTLRIGVQTIGDDYANTPPAHALARRGVIQNVRGYTVIGDYSRPHPASDIVDAVANGDVDVGVVWGPLAGYFAAREPERLKLEPVTPQIDTPFLPFVFDIALGVRRENTALRDRLEQVLVNRKPAIDSILADYGVPRVDRVRIAGGSGA